MLRPAVTFPAAEHHCPLAGAKFYSLMIEAHRCEVIDINLRYWCGK